MLAVKPPYYVVLWYWSVGGSMETTLFSSQLVWKSVSRVIETGTESGREDQGVPTPDRRGLPAASYHYCSSKVPQRELTTCVVSERIVTIVRAFFFPGFSIICKLFHIKIEYLQAY